MRKTIEPGGTLRGSPTLPGDKSISHRYAILAAMAEGRTTIDNYSDSEDCAATLNCVQALGADVKRDGRRVGIESAGWRRWREPDGPLDARNSGTLMRLLAGPLAGADFESVLSGDESLSRRPMKRILVPLERMGAEIGSSRGGLPPLRIRGRTLRGIRYAPPVASAQVKSCVLLAGLVANGRTTVVERADTRDHTERCLPHFGAGFRRGGGEMTVRGAARLRATETTIPGDFSAAVFFIVAALCLPGAEILLPSAGVNPSRTRLLDLLGEAGFEAKRRDPRRHNDEPVCDLQLRHQPGVLESFPSEIRGHWIPSLIDEIPALAVLGTRLANGLEVRDAGELRKKECDRISAVVDNLRALGVEAAESEDGFSIPPGQSLKSGRVRSFGDHRIAMAFAVAGLLAEGPVEIDDADCAAVSYPAFFSELEKLRSRGGNG